MSYDTIRIATEEAGSVHLPVGATDFTMEAQERIRSAVQDRLGVDIGVQELQDRYAGLTADDETIARACHLVDGWQELASTDLASIITGEKRYLDTERIGDVMKAVVGASTEQATTADEMGVLSSNSAFMERVRANVELRSADGLRDLGQIANGVHKGITGTTLSAATQDALGPGIDAVSITYLEVANRRTGNSVDPVNVDAAAVDSALGR